MTWLRVLVAVPLLCLPVACGDEDVSSSPTDGGAGAAGAGGSAGAAGSAGSESASCGDSVGATDLEGGSWDERFTIAGVSSRYGIAPAVYDFAEDVDGSLVAAGRFDSFEGEPVPPLMRWKDGKWQPARTTWEIAAPDDGFSAVAISSTGTLALATNDSFGERSGEIWIDEGSGLESIGAFEGQLRSLAFYGGKLWAAGLFALDHGTTTIEGLAVWDGTSWSAAPGGAVAGATFELYVDGSTLFVGGAFTSIGGIAAANVAAYDGTKWTAYDLPGALAVYALVRAQGDLYVGGGFGELTQAGGIARWDGTSWKVVGGGLAQYQTRGVVTDLVAHGNVVDAIGCFTTAGGLPETSGAIASRSLARWDGSAWTSLDDDLGGAITPWFQPGVCGDEGLTAIWDVNHQRLAHDGTRLVAGGMFAGVDGVLSQSLIAHDGSKWLAQGTDELGFGGSSDRIRAGGESCSVYGVGTFSHVAGSKAVGRVVHFDGTAWVSLSDSLPSDAWCPALDVSEAGEVAVGCMVFPPSGDAIGTILRREGNAMVAVETPALGPVMAVEWSASGALWIVGAGATGYLAKLEGAELTIVEDGFDGGVTEIDVASDTDIVVAGSFTNVGSVAAARIARWDGNAWAALGDGLPGQALALERDATRTYVSSYDEGSGAYLLGAFDGTTWQELAGIEAGITPKPEFSFNAIRAVAGGLILVGSAELDDASGRGAFVYRDGKLRALGGGVSAIGLEDIALTGDAVWLGGIISAAGGETTSIPSVGVARYVLAAPSR